MAIKSTERRVDELEIEVASLSGGGISDGDKGDITVSSSGSVWIINSGAVTDSKISSGITASKITQDSTHRFATDTEKSTWNGKADLVSGVVPTSQIPAIAITEFLGSVSSQSAMLALSGQVGDWCIRTDEQYGYVIIGSDPSILANWQKIVTPASPVTSVNSQVGTVVLSASDVGAPSGSGSSIGTNTGDETTSTIKTKLGITTLSGSNTGDETTATIKTKLGAASGSTDGYLTATDYVSFNAKQNALGFTPVPTTRSIATSSPLAGGGDLSADRTLSISQANTSTNGYLSSTDWNTFNNKQNTFSRKINGVTFDASSDIQVDLNIISFQALGSSIKATVLGLPIHQSTLASTLTSQQGRYVYIPIPLGATITGVKFFQTTQGVYTANNYNGIGLYTISAGTLTLVASSTNDGNIWKGTSNTWQTKAFTTPYVATAGVYFLGMLYSSSAQTTAPVVLSHSNMINNAFLTMDFANSVKLVGAVTGQTALPSSLASSGITANIAAGFAAYLY